MPRRYKKKKTYRKRAKKYALNKTVGNTPIPKNFKTTMRYVETLALNPGAGTNATYVFSANGMNDPNITGGGHQPRGYDQIMAMFNHYTVIGSRILIQATNRDSGNGCVLGIATRGNFTTEASIAEYVEQAKCSYKPIGPIGSPPVSVTASVAPKRFLGLPARDDLMRGTVSTNPAEQCYYHVFAGNPGGIDVGIVDVLVTIEYIAVFSEPKDLLAS